MTLSLFNWTIFCHSLQFCGYYGLHILSLCLVIFSYRLHEPTYMVVTANSVSLSLKVPMNKSTYCLHHKSKFPLHLLALEDRFWDGFVFKALSWNYCHSSFPSYISSVKSSNSTLWPNLMRRHQNQEGRIKFFSWD